MDNQMRSIRSESDLTYYESQLKNICCENEEKVQKSIFCHHLTTHKGKLVRIEMSGKCQGRFKVGKLLDVGDDYIVIKTGNAPISTVIPTSNIECITFIHNK